MPKRPNPEMIDDENPEWTEEDLAAAKSLHDLPKDHRDVLKGTVGKSAGAKKIPVPLPRDVVTRMRATGEGWEQRVEEAVRQWLERRAKRRRMAS